MSSLASDVRAALARRADAETAANYARFFQTHPGGYGEGDVFIGVRVPAVRTVAAEHSDLPLAEIRDLLDDHEHEHRLIALILAVNQFRTALKPRSLDPQRRADLHALYLDAARAGCVDNWDLVDTSAETLVGLHLLTSDAPDSMLTALVAEEDLWLRRIGIVATFAATKAGDPEPIFAAARAVLDDRRDLIQKATGWMLREAGRRVSTDALVEFLFEHAAGMGRTCLSSATERIDPMVRTQLRAL